MSRLEQRHILLVEDEVLLALAVQGTLSDAGYPDVQLAFRLDQALNMVLSSPPALAILDVNLRGTLSFPVADVLAHAGIPFIFLTAYSRSSIPLKHRARPFLEKPSSEASIVSAVERALQSR